MKTFTHFTRLAAAVLAAMTVLASHADAQSVRIDGNWKFALGDASSMEADFTHGTEYFTYLCKVNSADHSHAPIAMNFDDSTWKDVTLPHDWAVDLPFSGEASHSHGYKTIGWKYPKNSVGWYRRKLEIPAEDKGRQIWLEFEGIYRDAEIFINGCYLGKETSGYTSATYNLSPYLNYGGDNVITVRCNASLEEGWYYEGAGIYRHVWLHKAGPVAMKPYSLKVDEKGAPTYETSLVPGADPAKVSERITYFDAEGNVDTDPSKLWSPDNPYLYTMKIDLLYDGELSASYTRRIGLRQVDFDLQEGLKINGEHIKLKGCNLHLDHAGVGSAIPDELWRYRLMRLKEFGFNAIRSSHNPASPAMLDLCDELGFLVIDENRQLGVNKAQLDDMRKMIERDRNHPSVILWSIGNEEWSVEWSEKGTQIAGIMTDFAHSIDPSRPTTYGSSGGRELVRGVDVFGYNYIVQNPVDEYHQSYPKHLAVGTEETSGAGTRGKYYTDGSKGWMTPLNRVDTLGRINVIEHGWKFYKERPWGLGLFYWTGLDYRGEPNPMKWPATGSQFGIFDYCGFPKDEAFYLAAAWTDTPVVHICGPYNGEVWVYSNCASVRLYENGKALKKQAMPEDGHLVWKVREDGEFRAVGYDQKGRRIAEDSYPFTCNKISVKPFAGKFKADGESVDIIDIETPDDTPLTVTGEGLEILGWGNGDPGFKYIERPLEGENSIVVHPFSNKAQVIVRSLKKETAETQRISAEISENSILLKVENPR